MQNKWSDGLDWAIILGTLFFQIGALSALFFFTWKAFFLFFILYVITGMAVTLGYHRLLTHGSFTTYRPIKWFLAFLGQLSAEGSAAFWVAIHRKHHAFTDKEGDPHSPLDGVLWSHMLWFFPKKDQIALIQKYAPDIWSDPVLKWMHYLFLPILIIFAFILYGIGCFWDQYTALSFLAWGFLLRAWFVAHVTWCVNSASHIWGYRNYETPDESRNLWWVALLSFGEGWHNNHHAYQRMARHGHKWWEIDTTYWMICILEKCGLAWHVSHDLRRDND